MNIAKRVVGLLMIFIGMFVLFFVMAINSGHTSSLSSTTEDVLYVLAGLALIAGGIFAISKSGRKRA